MRDDEIYRVLELAPGADPASVKQAYRRLAAEYHPDRRTDPESRARFVAVNAAWAAWSTAHGTAPAPTAPPIDTEEIFSAFGDLFGAFFNANAATKPTRGADRTQPLVLSTAEARLGSSREVEVTHQERCSRCDGTGACDCAGGLRERVHVITVKVPPGVEAGQVLRLAGKGDEALGLPPGHLYLRLEIDALVDQEVIEAEVTARQFLFGGSLQVATRDGTASVRVPRGVIDGASIALPYQPREVHYRGASPRPQLVVFRVPYRVARLPQAITWAALLVVVIGLLYAIL